MAAPAMKIVFVLLTLVTLGMIIGALIQLAFIRRLEDSSGAKFPAFRRKQLTGDYGNLNSVQGSSYWGNDKDAVTLRVGYVCSLSWLVIGFPFVHTSYPDECWHLINRYIPTYRIVIDQVKPKIISWSPRIIVFHNFLSIEECDYLRALASPRLQVSTVVDAKTGKGIKSDVRTSSGMFLNPEERKYPMIQAIEKRISVYSQVPVENGELIQVLRYEKGQFYRPHHDYFSDTFNLKRGGQRVATMLMYLSENVEGGETFFPVAGSGECSCGGKMVKGKCVKPIKGDAVLFWSMGLDGQSDPNSIHGGCDVLSGEKWSATKWMRQQKTS